MAEPVRARRLTDQEGRRLLQIVRRGKHGSVRVRAMIIMASVSGTLVPAIARLAAADEDTVRDVIHAFNARGLAALDPRWAGGRPRLISDGDIEVIVTAARTRPEKPVQPFTRWSLRKLAGYLAGPGRPVRIGRERPRQLLHERGICFQRTRTVASPPASPGRCRSGPATACAGRRANGRPGCARLIIAPTASATSMAATAWAMTSCGA
jgi:transposase